MASGDTLSSIADKYYGAAESGR
nr:LysM domain-containing protein [Paraburkholderia phytofirmans]